MAFSPVRRPSARLTGLPACAQATKMIANISNNNLRKKRTTCYCAHPACFVFCMLSAPVLLVGLLNLNDAVPTSARRVLSEEKVVHVDLFDVLKASIIFPVAEYFFKKVLVPRIRTMWEKVKKMRMKKTSKKKIGIRGLSSVRIVPTDSTRDSALDDESSRVEDSEKDHTGSTRRARSEPTGSTRVIV